MRVLVTGSSGFVGSHLVEELLRRGHRVRVLLRHGGGSGHPAGPALERVIGNYDDPAALDAAVNRIDIIFHVGGVTKARNAAGYSDGNVVPVRNLLAAAARAKKPPRRFLLVSSIAAAGPVCRPDLAADEDDVPRPVEAYGRSKLAAELVARSWSHLVPVTIVRPPTVYGPRDSDCLVLFRLLKKRVNLFYGNAGKRTSIIHVGDLVEGMIRAAMAKGAVNRTYFLCNDEAPTWREFQESIRRVMGVRALTVHLPSSAPRIAALFGELYMKLSGRSVLLNREKVRLGEPRWWIASNERARRELGFRPMRDLEKGLAETLAWYRENGHL